MIVHPHISYALTNPTNAYLLLHKSSLLTTFLLRRHNPEISICSLLLLARSFLLRSLLRHLTPATGTSRRRTSGTSALGRRRGVDETLVRETLATDEVFGEVAGVDRVAVGVDGFDEDFCVGREEDELGDKFFG